MREQTRDVLALSLSLTMTPIFVGLYWLYFSGGSTVYNAMVLNHDRAVQLEDGTRFAVGEDLVTALQEESYADGQSILKVTMVDDREEAEARLKNRKAQVLLIMPESLSETILAAKMGEDPEPVSVTFVGDVTNPYYSLAAVLAYAGLDSYVQVVTEDVRPVQMDEIPLGESIARTEFEIYIPGLLIFSVVMMIFDASMVVAHEVEAGTFSRLKITKVTAFELLGGISASVVLLGMIGLLLAFFTAAALGFHSAGPLWIALLVGGITSFSVIGAGLMVAAFSKNSNQAFVIANFPLVLFMFFSGAIYPIPAIQLFNLGDISISLYDFLPPTHAR
jgi:ABC-2 type transport system permease protein